MITHNPLHGSGRAALPHPALALGTDAHAAQGIGMTDRRQGQPASDEAPHAIPAYATVLAAPRQRAISEPSNLESKKSQRRIVHGHSVIPHVSTHHRLQPLAHLWNGFVHAPLNFGFHLVQFRLQPLAYRLPQHRKSSVASLLYADKRKAKKVERLRFPFSTPLPLVNRKRTKLQQPRFLGMQFQVKLSIHAWRSFILQTEVSHAQRFQVVDVVQKRDEPQLLIFSCCLTYPLQRTRRVFPARCPGRVLLWQVPFGQSPSLVRGVSDRAGLWYTSRYRCIRCCLPFSPTASASRSRFLTRLNTRHRPRERLRMTQGRYGSLIHFRMTFSFTTTSPV
jgi:hypothetical protein